MPENSQVCDGFGRDKTLPLFLSRFISLLSAKHVERSLPAPVLRLARSVWLSLRRGMLPVNIPEGNNIVLRVDVDLGARQWQREFRATRLRLRTWVRRKQP